MFRNFVLNSLLVAINSLYILFILKQLGVATFIQTNKNIEIRLKYCEMRVEDCEKPFKHCEM